MSGSESKIWIGRGGKKYGPYSEASIRRWLKEGKLTSDTSVWTPGMASWGALSTLIIDDDTQQLLPTMLEPKSSADHQSYVAPLAAAPASPANSFVANKHRLKQKKRGPLWPWILGLLAIACGLFIATRLNTGGIGADIKGINSESSSPRPVEPPMTDREIEQCEMAANIAVRSTAPLAQIYGQDYVAKMAMQRIQKLSPACQARIAHEWANL